MEGRREGSKQGRRILCVFVFFSLLSLPTGARLVVAGGQRAEAVRLERSPSPARPLCRVARDAEGGLAALRRSLSGTCALRMAKRHP